MFEVYVNTPGSAEPQDDIYYLVAENGVFLVKRSGFFKSSRLVFAPSATNPRKIAFLEPHTESVQLGLPKKIPSSLLEKIIGFFQAVYMKFEGAEAIVLLYWSEKAQTYAVKVPKQEVRTGLLAKYEVGEMPKDLRKLGTIHSHGALPAFHSGVDHRDEEFDDGIHITVGTVDVAPSLSCSVVIDGKRDIISTGDIFEMEKRTIPDKEWMRQVSKHVPEQIVQQPYNTGFYGNYGSFGSPTTPRIDNKQRRVRTGFQGWGEANKKGRP